MIQCRRLYMPEGKRLWIQGEEADIGYQGKMMEAAGFLIPFRFVSKTQLEYAPPEHMESLAAICLKGPNRKQLKKLLSAVERAQAELESYLLDTDRLLFDADWLFYDGAEDSVRLIYVPWDRRPGEHRKDQASITNDADQGRIFVWKDRKKPGTSLERSLCRYLWNTAAKRRWDKDLWSVIAEYSAFIFSGQEEKAPAKLDPVREQALDTLIDVSSEPEEKALKRFMKRISDKRIHISLS